MIDGELTPVAIDAEGQLVPYQPPPTAGGAGADVPPEGFAGQPRLRDEAAPATGVGGGPSRAEVEPPTGPSPAPTGSTGTGVSPPTGPLAGSSGATTTGRIEIPSVSEVDINPRIPVLDADGAPTGYIEPGPREIHFDADGNPVFAQRTFPAEPAIRRGGGISAPVQEVYDSSIEYQPLTGENAPPKAPPVGDPGPTGSDAS